MFLDQSNFIVWLPLLLEILGNMLQSVTKSFLKSQIASFKFIRFRYLNKSWVYLVAANLAQLEILVCVRSKLGPRFSQVWPIHPPTEVFLLASGIEATLFKTFSSEIARLHVYVTTLGKIYLPKITKNSSS